MFNYNFFILAALAGIAAAQDSVTVCHAINYGAPCVFAPNNQGRCNNVGPNENDVISSVRLGPNTACRFWEDANCQGNSLIVRVDTPDLRTVGFNDVISSFTCFPA